MIERSPSSRRVPTSSRLVWETAAGTGLRRRPDELAVEEPLEIRVGRADGPPEVLTVTMRTPGHDFELATGWLLSEGIVSSRSELRAVRYCTDPELDAEQRYNVVTVDLTPSAMAGLEEKGVRSRLGMTSSSCGVCGTASIDLLFERAVPSVPVVGTKTSFSLGALVTWPELLREAQAGFSATGGLHAAGLVGPDGALLVAREDIGRHNAVDKVIGWALLQERRLPLSSFGLVVSGRSSFEIVQKAIVAGIPVVAGVSAASSLAARLAEEGGLTLAGFVRNGGATLYSHPEQLSSEP